MDTNIKASIIGVAFTFLVLVGTAYGILKSDDINLRKDVSYVQKEVVRIDSQHNSRIQTNQISIENVSTRVAQLEAIIPQILNGINDIKGDTKFLRKTVNQTQVEVGILKGKQGG